MNRRRFLSTAALASTGTLLGLGGCSRSGSQNNTIKVISSMPRTGSAQGQTDTIVNGIKMAIDEYGGEAGGFKIEYLDRDDATAANGDWTPEAETTNAQAAETDPDVMAFIGPYNTGAAEISAPILNGAGIVQISPAVTGPQMTKPGFKVGMPQAFQMSGKKTFCRVVPTDDVQSFVGAVYIATRLNKKRVFLLDDRSPYGKGIADLFTKVAPGVGLEVIGRDDIDRSSTDYKGLARKLATDFKPEVVYFGGTTQTNAGQVVKDLFPAMPSLVMVAPDGCYEESFISSAGADVNGRTFVTFGGLDPSKLTGAGKTFAEKYMAKFGGAPEGYAIYGYEAAKVLMEAINRVRTKDREAIREAVLATRDFDKGALGKWSFDENGDTTQSQFTVSGIEKGKFTPVWEPTGAELQKFRKS